MRKKILCLCMCAAVLLAMTLHAYAEETGNHLSISTAEEFLAFAKNCRLDSYSQGLTVTLEKNIDLSGTAFTPIPIFSGSFDGNGHIISGVTITAEGSTQGLFRYLTTTAVVQNLIVSGEIIPGGSRNIAGAIAGHNQGLIRYCGFTGTVSGSDYVGGVVGCNGVTGIIENCLVRGNIYGDHFVGGIAGENMGVIRNCTNEGSINTTPQQNSIEISDITMDTLTNTEAANTVTDIGGITGLSTGVIRDCKNLGDVGYRHMGYNIGGIAGTQSGYIVGCENHGHIEGRKEVGGIVGQAEPTSVIEYSEDTLQTLKGQLGELSGLVNQASSNAQANANQISGQIGVLQNQTQAAQGAVDALIPDQSNPELPDPDATLAAYNTLSSNLNAMPGTLSSITAATKTTANSLSRDINAISGQIGKMETTLDTASENLGGSIMDISDQDTDETLTGKVENCVNYGAVLADLNAGGIAGAMAIENDMDILEDWEQSGEESLNFESQLRVVILNCENKASVTARKQNAGGITGWQAMGLVKNSTNTGKLDCDGADYVGGISGLSTGYIRHSFAKCEVVAGTYAGGIAGSGAIVTDCLAQIKASTSAENAGAILGAMGQTDVEDPIAHNYYLVVDHDHGGIDGISYAGLAESIGLEAFLEVVDLPDIFHTVTVRFDIPDGEPVEIQLPSGSALDENMIPSVPNKNGQAGKWDGLEDAQLNRVMFDMHFEAVYTAYAGVIASEAKRENGLPLLLLEGSFANAATVQMDRTDMAPALDEKEVLLEAWHLTASEAGSKVRFLLPEGIETDNVKLLIRSGENEWAETAFTQDGSYLVFPATSANLYIALVEVPFHISVWLIAGAALILLLPIPFIIVAKKKKKAS